MNQYNDLKERHTQETWKLFGAKAPANTRPSITSMWEQRTNNSSRESSRNSPWSPSSTSNAPSPTSWSKQNPWTPSNGEKDKKITYWNSWSKLLFYILPPIGEFITNFWILKFQVKFFVKKKMLMAVICKINIVKLTIKWLLTFSLMPCDWYSHHTTCTKNQLFVWRQPAHRDVVLFWLIM